MDNNQISSPYDAPAKEFLQRVIQKGKIPLPSPDRIPMPNSQGKTPSQPIIVR